MNNNKNEQLINCEVPFYVFVVNKKMWEFFYMQEYAKSVIAENRQEKKQMLQ